MIGEGNIPKPLRLTTHSTGARISVPLMRDLALSALYARLVMPGVRLVRFLKCTKQMGLHIHSLGQLPATVERAYYVYLLDYGWHEPLGAAERGADAAEQDAEQVAGEARVVGQEGADPLRQGEHPLGDGRGSRTWLMGWAATSTMRRWISSKIWPTRLL